ncbi:hypothetical protein MKEN_00696500 [Mycena kentingensis (nom. inval.)]|nr:hypothetical protein MKEN_00696500 [Mycena kentingensis (nom. inval.)]
MKYFTTASILLALVAHVSAHAMVNPALGVKGAPQRGDTQRPNNNNPCGNVNIALKLDSSKATPVRADGTVKVQMINFNGGKDGSRQVAVQVSANGSGKNLKNAVVKKNGNPNPSGTGSDDIVFALAAGTKCTGGKSGNLCLVSLKTTSGFGGCTVVSQGSPAPGSAPVKNNGQGQNQQNGLNQNGLGQAPKPQNGGQQGQKNNNGQQQNQANGNNGKSNQNTTVNAGKGKGKQSGNGQGARKDYRYKNGQKKQGRR